MIYLKLLYNFLIVGAFSFGGAYSAIPLVKDVAERFDVITKEALANFIAISESTPGSVGVNLATFVGTVTADIPGAIVATFAEVLPAFIIMLLVSIYFKDILKKNSVKFLLSVIRPCIIGIIMSVGISMFIGNLYLIDIITMKQFSHSTGKSITVFLAMLICMFLYNKIAKKSLGAIKMIIIGAIFGIAINIFV